MEQKICIRKNAYRKEAIIVALQRYLRNYWVTISDDKADYCIRFESKNGGNVRVSENEFNNELIEAEFIYMKSMESLPLRTTILKKALGPYHGENG